jgi:hypothetical protein
MSDHAEALCNRARAGDIPAASELVGLFYERILPGSGVSAATTTTLLT